MADQPSTFELDEIYDPATLRALDRAAGGRPSTAEPRRQGARGLGLVMAATALALHDVFEPEGPKESVVELDPDADGTERRWVTVVLVPGAPRASRIIVRPWLAPPAA